MSLTWLKSCGLGKEEERLEEDEDAYFLKSKELVFIYFGHGRDGLVQALENLSSSLLAPALSWWSIPP